MVTFNIVDADDLPVWTMPVFPYIAVVPTDAPNQACIYTLQASDPDLGSDITYSLRAGKLQPGIGPKANRPLKAKQCPFKKKIGC